MDLIQSAMDTPHLDASFDMLKCWYMMYIKFFKVDWSQKFWWKSSKNWHPRKKKFFSHFFTNFFVPTFSNDLKYTLITFYSMIKQRSNNFSSLSCVTVPKPRVRPQKPRVRPHLQSCQEKSYHINFLFGFRKYFFIGVSYGHDCFQIPLEIFLLTLRACSRYLKGTPIVSCVRQKIMTARRTHRKTSTKKKDFSQLPLTQL